MIQDKGLRMVRSAFKQWVKVCVLQATQEANELKSKETVKRYVYVDTLSW